MNHSRFSYPRSETSPVAGAALLLFLSVYACLLCFEFYTDVRYHDFFSWSLNDWLINYHGGFVRRGLVGSLLISLVNPLKLDAYVALLIAVNIATATIAYIYLKKLVSIAVTDTASLMLLLFTPGLLLFPLLDTGALGRKDVLFILFVLAHLRLIEKHFAHLRVGKTGSATASPDQIRRYLVQALIILSAIGIPVALTHEGVLFLALPVSCMLTFSATSLTESRARAIVAALLVHLPSMLTACACFFVFRGTEAQAWAICEALETHGILHCGDVLPPAIVTLAWTNESFLSRALDHATRNGGLPLFLWFAVLSANFALVAIAIRRVVSRYVGGSAEPGTLIADLAVKYFLIPLVGAAPLFVLVTDWGRYFVIVLFGYVLCALTPTVLAIEIESRSNSKSGRWPADGESAGRKAVRWISDRAFVLQRRAKHAGVLVAIYVCTFTHIPHAGIETPALSTGVVTQFVHVVRRVVGKVITLF
jgi:hypothetical protein